MRLVKYSNLSFAAKQQVKSAFVHWKYDTTSKTFEEWANKKAFYVRADGKLSNRHRHCEPAFMAS